MTSRWSVFIQLYLRDKLRVCVCVCVCADHVTLVSVNSLESTASGGEDVAVR